VLVENRARHWLSRRLPGVEPTPLLVSRLEARRRGLQAELITVAVCVAAMLVWAAVDRRNRPPVGPDAVDVRGLVLFIGINLALVLGMSAGILRRRGLERAALAGRTVRSAHPSAASVGRLIGERMRTMVIAVQGCGVVLGAAVALFAPREPDRIFGLAFLIGVGVLGALGAVNLAAVMRRPALAEDSESLVVDDLLRAEDARRAVAPYSVMVALVAGTGTADSWVVWPFLCFAVLGLAYWMLTERAVTCQVVAVP
jgi:hypothetical protein